MTKCLIIILVTILFLFFLYWGYLPDYKRNPKEFWRTLVGMPIGMLLEGIGFRTMNERIRKWAIHERKRKDGEELK